ncbi:MAG TPA: hypothetical protein PLD86_19435 [Vicinamibacteria bacterium]|nr:hypothetical protein [Vicinamibacteria bacterium]
MSKEEGGRLLALLALLRPPSPCPGTTRPSARSEMRSRLKGGRAP